MKIKKHENPPVLFQHLLVGAVFELYRTNSCYMKTGLYEYKTNDGAFFRHNCVNLRTAGRDYIRDEEHVTHYPNATLDLNPSD